MSWRDRGIQIKTDEQIVLMRRAGALVGETLELVRAAAAVGVTTAELDAIAEAHIRDNGGIPSFKGYSHPPFPATICASVNDEVVHGIPGERVLEAGDVLSVDCGAIVDGWHGDAAITLVVGGEAPSGVEELLQVTEAALWAGISAAVAGSRVSDISRAVESSIRSAGDFGIVPDYTGHGIGTEMHMEPDVPNVVRGGRSGRSPRLVPGMAIAIEPMVTSGSAETDLLADDWTVATVDGSIAAHFEHTVAITERGPWVLTADDGGRARLSALGIDCGAPQD